MKNRLGTILTVAFCSLAVTAEVASAQAWASWTLPGNCAGPVTGSFGSTTVNYSGPFNGVQNSSLGTCTNSSFGFAAGNYFTPGNVYSPAPTNPSFIQLVNMVRLNQDGSAYVPISVSTITFSQAVINPYFAIISAGNLENVNGSPATTVNYTFDHAFKVISYNPMGGATPFWGNTSSIFGTDEMTTLAAQEFSGVLQFTGTFTSLSFTVDKDENWHGFTVGAAAISTVPEPSTYVLMAAGLLAMGVVARRRRNG